ncbi:MAG: caspase family protein [Beijerinckiaceae bacterium]
MSKRRSLASRFSRLIRSVSVTAASAVFVGLIVTSPAQAQGKQKRVALVIGNSEYAHLPKLKNPTNDMREVANTLRAAQFEVFNGRDLSRIDFEELMKTFLRAVENADVSLVYYSGHGIQIGGKNYLVPVDAKLSTPYDVEIESVNVDNIYGYLRENSRMQLVFLDACRDNPFRADQYWVADRLEKAAKSVGLAPPTALATSARRGFGMGSLFAFSTEPDKVAYDGAGDLSHYTQAFIKRALTPNQEVRQMLTQVRRDVITSTNGQQIPWENSSLVDDFFMVKLPSGPVPTPIHRVSVAMGAPSVIDLPAPRSPAGSPLTIQFDRGPERGRLMLGNQPLKAGAPLQVADLARLHYDPAGAANGHVELITYSVTDSWKQSAQGAVAIAVNDGAQTARSSKPAVRVADAVVPVRNREAHAYIAGLSRAAPRPIIGVGAGPLALPAPARLEPVDTLNVTFTDIPGTGALYANGKRIEKGTALPLAEMPALTFEPQIGTQGQPQTVRFALDTGDKRTAGSLTIQPTLHTCDVEAAEPFDLQGVAVGKLPSEINAPVALKACTEATERYPSVARFQFQLGRAQLAARGVDVAWRSVEKAADAGHVRALYQLGYLYRLGVGRPASQSAAVDYFRRGSERGDPYGIYDYGKALFYGLGVEKDVAQGLRLMLRAADMGHTYAMNELGYLFIQGANVQQDTERGMRFYRSGVARRDIYSFNNVGLAHLNGKGAPRDLKAAADLFRRASDGGHPYAPTNLGRLYRDGAGVPRNEAQAATLFERGAERGDYWGALDRARLAMQGSGKLRNGADSAYYLALAAAINRAGVGDTENRAKTMLADMPMADKQKAEQRLLQQLGPSVVPAQADRPFDDRLISLSRQAWEKRNPRIDLF